MKLNYLLALFMCLLLPVSNIKAQVPAFPEGVLTKWVIEDPEEIVTYLIFDPTTVEERIPSSLRFITIKELADGNVSWAKEHLKENPTHLKWGISFLEIIRMKIFAIDEQMPKFPENGAVAVWFARVAQTDTGTDFGPGKPFLALDFWMPDSMYAIYMRSKGHYASYGDVRLKKNLNGKWIGSINVDGLQLNCSCLPKPDIESSGSNGIQIIIPPAQSEVKDFVRIAFAGHQIQTCADESFWIFKGAHPLVSGIVLGPSSYQFGYHLRGGAFRP